MGERAQDCPSRIASGLGSGFVAGSLFGAVASNWGDVPVVLRDKPWPALVRTGSVMAQYGSTVAMVGAAYATVDVSAPPLHVLLPALSCAAPSPICFRFATPPTHCAAAGVLVLERSAWQRASEAKRTGSTGHLEARQQAWY
jgi:hypothetical protein